MQNKLHYAIHGSTAAEVIYARADHQKKNMGLTSFIQDKAFVSDFDKYLTELENIISG